MAAARAPDAQALLRTLVGFDTTSRRSNLELIDWVAAYLGGLGIPVHLTHDDVGGKANLLAVIGPERPGGVLLSGHTDVVPVDGQDWTGDPFVLREEAGRLYGRGTADMKGFLACCLEQAGLLAEAELRRPIFLAFSYDEELGCLGAPRLIEDLVARFPRPVAAIVGEPTGMELVSAHKGAYVFRTVITGRPAHSSAPALGVSAIQAATEFMAFLFASAEAFKAERSALPGLEPPYTTLNVGMIEGGTALNIVPASCALIWEFRPHPDADVQSMRQRIDAFVDTVMRPKLKAEWPGAGIESAELAAVPPLRPDPESEAEALVRGLTGANGAAAAVSFGTEAGLFQAAGIPTVVCGPGSIEQAHQPDEWLAVEQLQAARLFLAELGAWAARPEA